MATTPHFKMSFPGGKQVATTLGGHTILTDQPVASGGQDAAPSPFDLFLASIGTCAGFYALSFCQQREIATEGMELVATPLREEGKLVGVEIAVTLPPDFPERYQKALLRSVEQCSVQRAIQAQPEFRCVIR